MTTDTKAPVLVTGGTGYLAGWCVRELLGRGHAVRTTVRDLSREAELRAAVARGADDQLTVVGADLGSDGGWADAVEGCAYVLHVASPFPRTEPKDPDDIVRPAVDGTRRVLRAALDAGASRVVVTSSSTTVGHEDPADGAVLDESHWTDADSPRTRTYVRSKVLAEQAAWDLANGRGAQDRLVTVLPTAMLGPVLGPRLSYSVLAVSRLLAGDFPGLPRLGFSFVDVRDVAVLHVLAMTSPAAGGRRFIADAGFRWLAELAGVLRERLGDAASRVPTRKLPDVAVRFAALFDKEIKQVIGDLGHRTDYSTKAARTTFGWEPRPLADTITECAESLLAR